MLWTGYMVSQMDAKSANTGTTLGNGFVIAAASFAVPLLLDGESTLYIIMIIKMIYSHMIFK